MCEINLSCKTNSLCKTNPPCEINLTFPYVRICKKKKQIRGQVTDVLSLEVEFGILGAGRDIPPTRDIPWRIAYQLV
jgi:hypothetical protein